MANCSRLRCVSAASLEIVSNESGSFFIAVAVAIAVAIGICIGIGIAGYCQSSSYRSLL